LSGLAVERTKDRVVLKDARGETIEVLSAAIDRLAPQSRSLMPDLLVRDLTAQQICRFAGIPGIVEVTCGKLVWEDMRTLGLYNTVV
jgi:hypothetical protein